MLRRLGGQLIALNPDLIERVETTPDTVVTLVDEKKFLIEETLDDVLRLIVDYRAYIIARSRDISVTEYEPGGRPTLHVVPNELIGNAPIAGSGGLDEPDDREAEAVGVVRSLDGSDPDGGGRPDTDGFGGRFA
ncbi:MAG: flagellar FlbD family protein [Actinomycetota bacterium]